MDVSLLHQAKCIIKIGKMPSFTDRIEACLQSLLLLGGGAEGRSEVISP